VERNRQNVALSRMAIEQQRAKEASFLDGNLHALRDAVGMSKTDPAVTPDATGGGGGGGRGGWPIVGGVGRGMQRAGDFMRHNYWMMPRGFEMMTLRAGAWMSNIGGGLAGGALGGAALGIGAGAAGIGGFVAAVQLASGSLKKLTEEGISGFGRSLMGLSSIMSLGVTGAIYGNFRAMQDRFEKEAGDYKDFNAPIAAAFGHRDYIEKVGKYERGRALGPQLAEQVTNRTYLNEATSRMEGQGLKMLLDQFGPLVTDISMTLEGLALSVGNIVETANTVLNMIGGVENNPLTQFLIGFIPGLEAIGEAAKSFKQKALEERQKHAREQSLDLQKIFGNFDPIEIKPAVPLPAPAAQAPGAAGNPFRAAGQAAWDGGVEATRRAALNMIPGYGLVSWAFE
jgi:hypothetical protein